MSGTVDDLALVSRHTELLLDTAAGLSDLSAASLCQGWTRGHVLTHVARNAEAVGRLSRWALTGTRHEMYPGGSTARDAEIEAGAGRGTSEQVEDLRRTAADLEPLLAALSGPRAVEEVEMRGGLRTSADRLPFLRLREVVYHHVDLDAGFGFADVEPDLLRRFVADAVERLAADTRAPDLLVRSEEGAVWSTGSRVVSPVTGRLDGILLWLTRRDPRGVHSADPLPELPKGA
ncbi:maleylpyruvate isomerase family mycothiol-dependent enzyme [Pedococcus sp. 5OH_020]|uniref:maleylpyruvate isomerase family mycothiol-dependent enzyme n=1 Tax=Pedococcus sp. 5OH_020 TaxID=2989814 RepID=UPI0022E9A71D|nr:maleylpyruvate isomerase family mycothiol-dependent enzyme [Pedococcus sp. 5OH_020]